MTKVLISLDTQLLRQIDRRARKSGLSRSAYLARLAERDITRTVRPGAARSVHEALAAIDEILRKTP